jgi:mRNA-degrading endonuclease toxin of MazEF toxin-antitoxin module
MASRRRVVLLLTAAAAAAAAAALAARAVRRRRRAASSRQVEPEDYDGLDSAVSYSARSIAAARAVETARSDALFRDPFAAAFAGRALKAASARTSDGRIAVRTRYFDDALAVRDGETSSHSAAPLTPRPCAFAGGACGCAGRAGGAAGRGA